MDDLADLYLELDFQIEAIPDFLSDDNLTKLDFRWIAEVSTLLDAIGEFGLQKSFDSWAERLATDADRTLCLESILRILENGRARLWRKIPREQRPDVKTAVFGSSGSSLTSVQATGTPSAIYSASAGIRGAQANTYPRENNDGYDGTDDEVDGLRNDDDYQGYTRVRPPKIESYSSVGASGLTQDFEILQSRALVLKAALNAPKPAGMGHNGAPDGDFGEDEDWIQEFVARLNAQTASNPIDLPGLLEASKRTNPSVNRWRERLDNLAKGVAKGASEEIGKRLIQIPWWIAVYTALENVNQALAIWVRHFPLP